MKRGVNKSSKEEKLQNLQSEYEILQRQNDSKQTKIDELGQTLRNTRNALLNVKNLKSYRVTRLLADAIRRPRRFVKFPYRLAKIIFGKPLPSSLYLDDLVGTRSVKIRKNIPAFHLGGSARIKKRKLRVATVLDDFSHDSFSPECDILQLRTQYWQLEMEDFKPDILFVESAWRGINGNWEHLIANMSKDLDLLLKYCQQNNIPTVFWCKEDPVHFNKFINTAKYFDFIFTSDEGSIDRYKEIVGHNRVYSLRFAAQPRLMNPIEKYDRKDAVCFAGTYYVKYKQRVKEFGDIVDELLKNDYDIEIYDRNYNRGDPNYFYPDKYQPYVKGTLSFEEIDKAYKGYKYALTMNTIKDSKTMFARRALELLASNTITISNDCLGIKTQLGDLVVSAKTGKGVVSKLQQVASDESHARKFKLMGLREVLNHHTYDIRLSEICSAVFENYKQTLTTPKVSVVAKVDSLDELGWVIEMFEDQSYDNKELCLIARDALKVPKKYRRVNKDDAANILGEYATVFSPKDYYGRYFLLDLILGTKYTESPVVGKAAYYERGKAGPKLHHDGEQYKTDISAHPYASIVKTSELKDMKIFALANNPVKALGTHSNISIDEFNYCKNGKGLSAPLQQDIDGILDLDTGVGLKSN